MKITALASALLGVLLLGGCASLDVSDRMARAERLAGERRFSRIDIQTRHFDLVAFVGPQTPQDVLRVYIEGDGFAWVTRHQPSTNPTPIDPVALKLSLRDGDNVAYLGRPCQYVTIDERCHPRYWTSARFSSEVIEATDEAIDRLKQRASVEKIVLIGYSGGGAVAALVAARRTDVLRLVTVAGNLDPRRWAEWHSLPELRGSLNPKDYSGQLARIRQVHFVGERDRVIPAEIYHSYRSAFPDDADIMMKVLPQADHTCCWGNVWPRLLDESP